MTPLFGKATIHPKFPEAEMFCDGACSGNPGKAGIGIVIVFKDGKKEPLKISEYIGEATNNIAEYSSLIKGLIKAHESGVRKAKVYMDSELVVKQIKGEYKVRNETLRHFWSNAVKLIKKFDELEISHIRRERNNEADSLARAAIKRATKKTI
ncbi:MAG: ribonuclease HI family protein [Nitrospirae bacterium]|nr:ribonuclease HI family protein [Nitrospirota bacterium]